MNYGDEENHFTNSGRLLILQALIAIFPLWFNTSLSLFYLGILLMLFLVREGVKRRIVPVEPPDQVRIVLHLKIIFGFLSILPLIWFPYMLEKYGLGPELLNVVSFGLTTILSVIFLFLLSRERKKNDFLLKRH